MNEENKNYLLRNGFTELSTCFTKGSLEISKVSHIFFLNDPSGKPITWRYLGIDGKLSETLPIEMARLKAHQVQYCEKVIDALNQIPALEK